MNNNKCPVCSYSLEFEPWENNSPSDEICPQCWIHFWYDDLKEWEFRKWLYFWWRNKWILDWKKFWREE